MCHFAETLYFCGCAKECEFLLCDECIEAAQNVEGGYVCPKLGSEDQRTVLQRFCDNKTCAVRDGEGAEEEEGGRWNALRRNDQARECLRKEIELARERLRRGREEACMEKSVVGGGPNLIVGTNQEGLGQCGNQDASAENVMSEDMRERVCKWLEKIS